MESMLNDQGDPTLDYKYEPMFIEESDELFERIEANKDEIFLKEKRKKKYKHHHHHKSRNL